MIRVTPEELHKSPGDARRAIGSDPRLDAEPRDPRALTWLRVTDYDS